MCGYMEVWGGGRVRGRTHEAEANGADLLAAHGYGHDDCDVLST